MLEIRSGDIAISTYKVRQKDRIDDYYLFEPVSSKDNDGTPINLKGDRVTGVKAIYRRETNKTPLMEDNAMSIRYYPDMDIDNEELINALLQKYGHGKLLKPGLCEGFCRLRSLNDTKIIIYAMISIRYNIIITIINKINRT